MMVDVSDAEAFLDPEASRDYLRSWRADAERRAERAGSMAAQIEQLRSSAEDDNDLAQVTVDSSGVLVDLVLTERIHRYEPEVVARAVMSALREARTKAAEQAREIAVEAMGPDSMSARVIADRMQQLLERPDTVDDASTRQGGDSSQGWLFPGQDGSR
jgi:DNA-binding protein YbaB